ncbi:hypothetical protein DFH08DRAFT_811218 [Mycena albidolilacea]|uniref:Uncharacterized protein n=1 Tax=Mycena albidolilacea TaxID=1033008 RepID=A0AAD7EPP1_9AGAR|nr:hypothetical protein DFH08DRAFT_811218 [Mycena albidolilacea]
MPVGVNQSVDEHFTVPSSCLLQSIDLCTDSEGGGREGYAACIWEGIHERIIHRGGLLREITGSKILYSVLGPVRRRDQQPARVHRPGGHRRQAFSRLFHRQGLAGTAAGLAATQAIEAGIDEIKGLFERETSLDELD